MEMLAHLGRSLGRRMRWSWEGRYGDLLWEVMQNPRLRSSFLAMLIPFEVALIILALLIHGDLLTMKFSIGGFKVDVHP
jgi:hypothetical protein